MGVLTNRSRNLDSKAYELPVRVDSYRRQLLLYYDFRVPVPRLRLIVISNRMELGKGVYPITGFN